MANGRFTFGEVVYEAAKKQVDDLSMYDFQAHAGDPERIISEMPPWSFALLEKRDKAIPLELYGKEIKDCLGALWRAMCPVNDKAKAIPFPAMMI